MFTFSIIIEFRFFFNLKKIHIIKILIYFQNGVIVHSNFIYKKKK